MNKPPKTVTDHRQREQADVCQGSGNWGRGVVMGSGQEVWFGP